MATNPRKSNPSVKRSLEHETFSFDFHQAVEIIQKMHPESTPLGEGVDPDKEAIQIKSRVNMAVSSGEIHAFTPPKGAFEKPTLWINFLSIAGAGGPLPTPYTEMLMERTRNRDSGFQDFLDIFNHRLAAQLHRLKKRSHVGFSQVDPRENQVGKTLISLSGLDNHNLRNQLRLSDRTLMGYHDLLWRRSKSAKGLERMIASHFKMPARVEQFQGEWIKGPDHDTTKIGAQRGQFNALGRDTILGQKLWNQAANITIHMHVKNWAQLCQLLPVHLKDENGIVISGRDHNTLKDLILFYVGLDYKVKITLSLFKMNIKPLRLNRKFGLGLNSWLTSNRPIQKDVETSFWLRPEYLKPLMP